MNPDTVLTGASGVFCLGIATTILYLAVVFFIVYLALRFVRAWESIAQSADRIANKHGGSFKLLADPQADSPASADEAR